MVEMAGANATDIFSILYLTCGISHACIVFSLHGLSACKKDTRRSFKRIIVSREFLP